MNLPEKDIHEFVLELEQKKIDKERIKDCLKNKNIVKNIENCFKKDYSIVLTQERKEKIVKDIFEEELEKLSNQIKELEEEIEQTKYSHAIKQIMEKAKKEGFDYFDSLIHKYSKLAISFSRPPKLLTDEEVLGIVVPKIIFCKDFLKAYFGKNWQHHAKQLILAEDRIKYLMQFIDVLSN